MAKIQLKTKRVKAINEYGDILKYRLDLESLRQSETMYDKKGNINSDVDVPESPLFDYIPAVPKKHMEGLHGIWPYKQGSLTLLAFRLLLEEKLTKVELKNMWESIDAGFNPMWNTLRKQQTATHIWDMAENKKGVLVISNIRSKG